MSKSVHEQLEDFRRKIVKQRAQLAEANTLIAMQAEALKTIAETRGAEALAKIANEALSATSETVAAWRVKETEPLRRDIAMALAVLMSNHQWRIEYDAAGDYEGSELYNKNLDAINHTQATALAYEREVENRGAVKALEEILCAGLRSHDDVLFIRRKIAELRAANKEGETP